MRRPLLLVCLAAAAAAVAAGRGGLPREHLNPQGLAKPQGYTHVVAVRGGKTIFVSGQIALDAKGELVGRQDLRAQTQQAFENLKLALQAAGAGFRDVVKTTTYVVGLKPADTAVIRDVRAAYLTPLAAPASTLVGVQALARDGLLVEIEAIAVVP